MEPKIDEHALDEKLGALEKARPWNARVISKLETYIRSQDDYALFRINPLRFGAERNIAEAEVIDLFLFGAKLGLFLMNWELMCPQCGAPVQSFAELKSLHSHYYCALCHLHSEAVLDDYIQVDFTISPLVRDIAFHHPESLSVEDYVYKYHFYRGARMPGGGPPFAELMAAMVRWLSYVEPGQEGQAELELGPGVLIPHEFTRGTGAMIPVEGEAQAGPQTAILSFKGDGLVAETQALRPGKVSLRVENRDPRKIAVGVVHLPPGTQSTPVEFEPFLTGKRVLSTQTFRDLFRSEVIESTEGLAVRDLTILFTDLKGSTALYERIGDLNAFALVRQHFESLGAVIAAHGGAIVKTIGDAVMATFLDPVAGVRAALLILEEIEGLNHSLGRADVILKMGLHKGALIAVTLNDRLDYFGQTVNISSRVQGLADAEEIYITSEVFDYPGVKELLGDHQVSAVETQLRGIEQEVRVYKIAPSRS